MPLASPQHRLPGAYNLSVDLAARYEKFLTNSDSVTVPKIGVRYQPFDESLTIRGSAARGFLEPSLYKLYAGGVAGLLTLVDPRNGATQQETPATHKRICTVPGFMPMGFASLPPTVFAEGRLWWE